MADGSVDDRIRILLGELPDLLRADRPPSAAVARIAELARMLLRAEYAGAAVLHDDNRPDRPVFSGLPAAAARAVQRDPATAPFLRALSAAGRTLLVPGEPTDGGPALPAAHPPARGLVAAQVRQGRRSAGVLYVVGRPEDDPFDQHDEHLLGRLATVAAAVLANASLLRDALESRRWLRAASELSFELLSEGLDAPLRLIGERVRDLADAPVVGLAVLDGDHLVARYVHGVPSDAGLAGFRVPLGQTTWAQQVIASGRPRVFHDISPEDAAAAAALGLQGIGHAVLLPLRAAQDTLGLLLLARHAGAPRFTDTVVEVAGSFANQAALTLEVASAREVAEELHVLEERARIARDLHDHVIQRLYGTGMILQQAMAGLADGPSRQRVATAVNTLDDTIRQIRTTIMTLRTMEDDSTTLGALVSEIAQEAAPLLGFAPMLALEPPAAEITGRLAADLAACLREGVSNAVRHAQAGALLLEGRVVDDRLELVLRDDGVGIQSTRRSGLDNMATRVRPYGGRLDVDCPAQGGTVLRWTVPLPRTP